jgi:hypothetical protein
MSRLSHSLLNIAGFFYWLVVVAFFVIHIWSVAIIYNWHGIVGAVIGFFLPFVTEVFCFLDLVFYHHESVFGAYPLAIIIYIGIFLLMVCLFFFASKLEESEKK